MCLDTDYLKCLDGATPMYDNLCLDKKEVDVPPARGTKREAIRVEPELWREYGLACEAGNTNRSADIRDHMGRKVRAWKRKAKPTGVVVS